MKGERSIHWRYTTAAVSSDTSLCQDETHVFVQAVGGVSASEEQHVNSLFELRRKLLVSTGK